MIPPYNLNPLIWNSICTVIVFIYIMSVIKFMDFLVSKGFPQDISRKIVHIAAGSWVIFWPLYYGGHWSYTFNIAVALLWTILFLVKGFTATPEDTAVKTMTRTGNPKELLKGPLFFTLVMDVLGVFFFMKYSAVVTMAILGWGDGLAPVFGKYYGKRKYRLLGNEKSVEGSLGMFIFGIIGSLILVSIINPIGGPAGLIAMISDIVLIAFIATIVEALSPADIDNLLIPIVTMLYYFYVFPIIF